MTTAYRLEITRQPQWGEALGLPIALDEWCDLVDEDDELEWDAARGPSAAVWTGPGDGTPFNFADGVVWTENPGGFATWKMAQMADRLSAAVQGAQGERYDHNGNAYYTPEHQAWMATQQPRPSWRARMAFLTRLLGRRRQVDVARVAALEREHRMRRQ